jgi:S1-C subfamily serine protease
MPTPGESQSIPVDASPIVDSSVFDMTTATAGALAFVTEYRSNVRSTRNARDIAVFRDIAPAVVLIVAGDGLGSGSLLDNHMVLTNWHVVRGYRQVNVVFKPEDPNRLPSNGDMVAAQVIKSDPVRDLALLQPKALPSRAIKPIKISTQDNIEVGTDVHAIGHPTGQFWTYTTGIVSQLRPDYEWSGGDKDIKHHATVISHQGGPLLGDDEQLIGVNAFVTSGMQGLNFAISAKDVRAFLASPVAQNALEDECKFRVIFEGRSKENDSFMRKISLKCDDRADIIIVIPDDKTKAVRALVDISRRNKVEGVMACRKMEYILLGSQIG